VSGRETSVWMMTWKVLDFNAESRKEKLTRNFLFLIKFKKIFCASQITRSRSRKRERIITEKRKLLILLDHWQSQENMESRQNHFWYALIAPPFPPLSPPIQCLPGLSNDIHNNSNNNQQSNPNNKPSNVHSAVDNDTIRTSSVLVLHTTLFCLSFHRRTRTTIILYSSTTCIKSQTRSHSLERMSVGLDPR
jgi:hypothetical protein